jgi:hypothetical protein
MKLGARLLLGLMILLGAMNVGAQQIEISDSPAGGYPWEGCVPIGTSWTLYILARPGFSMPDGITGAEFYVSGLPAEWSVIATPNPSNLAALGDPFATAPPYRADIAFPACTAPDGNGVVLLYTVILFPTTTVINRSLIVTAADPPTNPTYLTPMLFGCDLDYTPHVATGNFFLMNPFEYHCALAVENAPWSGVKLLYRD